MKKYLNDKYLDQQKEGYDFLEKYQTYHQEFSQSKQIYSYQTTRYQVIGNYLSISYEKLVDLAELERPWFYRDYDYLQIVGKPPYQVNSANTFDLRTGKLLSLVDIFENEKAYQVAIGDNTEGEISIMKEIYNGTFADQLPFYLTNEGVIFMFNPIALNQDDKLVEVLVPYSQTKLDFTQ